MQSTLHCFGVSVVLFSLAPSTLSFSRGASHTSCQEMIPGHIRAQPLDPKHSHVTLRTSASSYLSGQLVTVTVRSSRDFMGFLLQARSVKGVGAGVRSRRLGPLLMGGSWTLTPPGTHTLRCLSEGDTLTHSDKQLKRNLSFVWRAPDVPMGDIRFYITVVQSYFVYWAGIESTVVRDGSHSPWRGSITGVDGGYSSFAQQEDEVTALLALIAHRASNKQTNKTATPATTLGSLTTTSSGTQSYKSQETPIEVTRPVLEMNISVTLASFEVNNLTNEAVNDRNSSVTLGSLQNATNNSETGTSSGSLSGVTEEAGTDTGSPVTHTKDPKSSRSSPNHLPFTAYISSAEAEATTTPLPNISVETLISPLSLASIHPLNNAEMERKEEQINFQDPKLPTVPETKYKTINPETTTTAIPLTNYSFHSTNPPRLTSHNPRGPIQDQTSSVKLETQSSSSQPWRISLTKSQMSLIKDAMSNQPLPQAQNPLLRLLLLSRTSSQKSSLQSQTVTGQTFLFSQESLSTPFSKSHPSLPNLIFPSKSPTLQSFLQSHTTSSLQPLQNKILNVPSNYQPVSPSGSKTIPRQTSSPHPQLKTTAQPHPLNSFLPALHQTIATQTAVKASFPHTDQSQSDTPPKALGTSPQSWSQPHSQTGAPQAHTFEWKLTQISVTPQFISPLPFMSRSNPTFILSEGKEVKELQFKGTIKTRSPIPASIPSATPFSFSGSTRSSKLHSLSFSSTYTLPASSLVYSSSTTPLYPSGASFTHSSFSSSSSMKKQPKTAPALSALPSPYPISIPPHFPSVLPSSTSPTPTPFTSSSLPSLNSSHYPSSTPFSSVSLSASSSSPFTSSQSITSLIFSSPSSTISIASSPSSISSAASPPSPPPSSSSISTSTLTSSSLGSSSPSNSFATFFATATPVPSQQLTLGQRLLIQNHIASSDPELNLNPPTPRTVVHPNPKPHPNLDPNFKLNLGHGLKPNPPNTDTKSKHPSSPSGTSDKEGKHPDIIPRYSALELGMLLGCSAGFGMVLVVGVRYMYRQSCGKRTEVTLNHREREHGSGERGLIHVQECGDLVRVRRIRENSFVLLAEYDILASPGD